MGWGVGGDARRNNIRLIQTCFYSEDSEMCPLTTKENKVQLKKKESERRRKKH